MGTPAPATLLNLPLIGRAPELRHLVDAYQLAQSGRANALVVVGEAGIGKTRLATEFVAWAAAQGADTLTGRAFETGGRLPYQPLVDALRQRLDRENAPEDLLSDVWLVELARLLPELADRYPDLKVPTGDETIARVRLFEAVARLGEALAACSNEPVVLFVDDIQWADTATLDVLRYVARRWAETGVSIVLLLNTRAEALIADPSLDEWLLGLDRDLPLRRLALETLGAEETEALVRGLGLEAEVDVEVPRSLGEAPRGPGTSLDVDFARWLFHETRGQPFFVTETLKALLERGLLSPRQRDDDAWALVVQTGMFDEASQHGFLAPGVRDVLHARLARLSPHAGMVLTAVAIVGHRYSFELLARVSELSEQEVLSALDEVLRGSVLRETGGTYQFAHDKFRELVYAEAGDARRRVFHRRAFEALEGDAVPPAELAQHAVAAGLNEHAFVLSVAAGDAAMRVLAAREAVEHYARARVIAEDHAWSHHLVDLHVKFGKAFVSLAQWADARREFEAALGAIGAEQLEQRGAILQDLLEVSWWSMDLPLLRIRAEELRHVGDELDRVDLQAAALSWLAPTAAADGDPAGCISLGEEALARGQALGFAAPPMMHTYLALPYYWLGRTQEAVERSREGLATARAANHTSATLHALPVLGLTLAATGRYDEAARVFDEARRFGSEYGVGTLLARAIAMSAGYHLDLLDYAANERLAEEARELARSLNFPPPKISAGLDLILNFARRQEVGRAEKLIDEVADVAQAATAWHGWLWGLRLAEARAEVALARGDWDGALNWAAQAIEQSRLKGRVKYEALGRMTRGRALVAIGRRSDALVDLGRALALARTTGDPALLVRAAGVMFDVNESEALAREIRASVDRIITAVSDDDARQSVQAADPVRKALAAVR